MTPPRPTLRALAFLACVLCLLATQAVSTAATRSRPLEGDRGSGPGMQLAPTAAPTNGITWSDVPKTHWARAAIDLVAATNDWMRDFRTATDGTTPFKPDAIESRRLFARAIVRAFAPDETEDPELVFPDLPTEDPAFHFANVAVKLGWMSVDGDGNFLPAEPVTVRSVHGALVPAMGLGDLAAGADALHLRNGTEIDTPAGFGALLVGMRAGLRYNHSDETLDVGPDSPLSRAEVAWSLYRAATASPWLHDSLAPYADMELPNLGTTMQRVAAFAVDYVGYPYVYGGEWNQPTPTGYCCGTQLVGGFDCSGLTWWIMREASSGWDNIPHRDYGGWSLPERSSAEMARGGTKIKRFEDLRAGDLIFYDGDGNGTVDHVNTYIGGGWAVDSSSSMGGVSIVRVDTGWYLDHFVRGRRILG